MKGYPFLHSKVPFAHQVLLESLLLVGVGLVQLCIQILNTAPPPRGVVGHPMGRASRTPRGALLRSSPGELVSKKKMDHEPMARENSKYQGTCGWDIS